MLFRKSFQALAKFFKGTAVKTPAAKRAYLPEFMPHDIIAPSVCFSPVGTFHILPPIRYAIDKFGNKKIRPLTIEDINNVDGINFHELYASRQEPEGKAKANAAAIAGSKKDANKPA